MDIRLFVDCDDTLALYCMGECPHGDIHPYGGKHMPWVPNQRLVGGIKAVSVQSPTTLIVVWSGGGREYAQGFIDKLFPDMGIAAMDKWIPSTYLAREGDIVIDDQWESMKAGREFADGVKFYGPNDWPVEKK